MGKREPGERARKRLVTRAGLALGSSMLAVLLLEGGARLYLGDELLNGLPTGESMEACAVHDPDLGWVNKPGVRTRVEAPKFAYRLAINSQGLRDREHTYAKPAGVFRIVLIGDSLAWGWGVDNGLTFADLVEAELGPEVEVVNLGVPGYSNDQELWMLQREGRRYEPDLVLLAFILNDVVGNDELQSGELAKPRYARGPGGEWVLENHPVQAARGAERRAPLGEWLWTRSGFMQLLRPADSERQLAESGKAVLERRTLNAPQASKLAAEQAEMRALADEIADPASVTFMLLTRLKEECDELGAPLVAFGIAHHHDRYLYSPSYPLPPLPPSSAGELRTDLTERLAEAGRLIGFRTFSVDQVMLDETEAGVGLACGDGHLNERGNEVVAGRIVQELEPLIQGLRGR
jgi:lysophospholipase L1-like esterase